MIRNTETQILLLNNYYLPADYALVHGQMRRNLVNQETYQYTCEEIRD